MPKISSLTTTLAAVAVTCMAYAASAADTASTNIVRNPTGGYTQRSVEIPPGSRILFISGQTATDAEGFTPPDAETQADIVYAKVEQTLERRRHGLERCGENQSVYDQSG